MIRNLEQQMLGLKQTAATFSNQLQEILKQIDQPEYQKLLQQRVGKAIHYFGEKISQRNFRTTASAYCVAAK